MQRLRQARLLYNTVLYLKPIQVYGRVWHKLYRPKVIKTSAPPKRVGTKHMVKPCSRRQSLINERTFRFLNKEFEVTSAADWNAESQSHLWIYNLHYFDFLRSGIDHSTGSHWIARWIKENPPGLASGWDPYTSALRIVNWIYWDLMEHKLSGTALDSLATQVWHLKKRIETHFQANHLLVDYKAIYIAGCFFDSSDFNKIRATSGKGLIREIKKQFGDDGGHFELSPMYHGIMVEDLVDVLAMQMKYPCLLNEQIDRELNSLLRNRLPNMLRWLTECTHLDGEYVLLNDAAMGIATCPKRILDFAERCGINPAQERIPIAHQHTTGHVRVLHGDLALYVDTGEVGASYCPAHAHADSLTFECSLFGKRFIVDTGTSEYAEGPTRTFQRSTAAHNTVEVDNTNSSEVWGAFRVARRARPGEVSVTEDRSTISITASHDGYKTILKGPTHKRIWEVRENRLSVKDFLEGPFKTAVSRFHLHPDVRWQFTDDSKLALTIDNRRVLFYCEGGSIEVLEASYSPEFGLVTGNAVINVTFHCQTITQTFEW